MIEVKDLHVAFPDRTGELEQAVNGITFTVGDGEILGIVGESGSGKTQTALALAGLSPRKARVSGSICLDGRELMGLSRDEIRKVQGKDIAMVFQEPMTSLDPTMRVGRQVEEVLEIHTRLDKNARRELALQALRDVELRDVETVYRKYPHELSGGQRQRVMIAGAVIGQPKLLIADEPTTALDVTIQAEILKLLKKLNREKGMAILFISHDLRVIRQLCDRTLVMHHGHIVEQGDVERVFRDPQDDYTKTLIASIPTRRC